MKVSILIIFILIIGCTPQIKPRGHCMEKCIVRVMNKLKNIDMGNRISLKDVFEICEKLYSENDSSCINNNFERITIE